MSRTELISKKKALLEALESVFSHIDYQTQDLKREYRKLDTQSQATRYNKETQRRELVFDDDGNPVMENDWGYVDFEEDKIPDENKEKLAAYKEIEKALEKLL